MLGYKAVAADPTGSLGGGRIVIGGGADVKGELIGGGVATTGALPGGKLVGVKSILPVPHN